MTVTRASRVTNDSETLAVGLALALPWPMVASLAITDTGGSVPRGTVAGKPEKKGEEGDINVFLKARIG